MNQVADLFQGEEELKRRRAQFKALCIVINSLAFEAEFSGLARTEVSYRVDLGMFIFSVWPVNTTSFEQSFVINVWSTWLHRDENFEETIATLELAQQFLRGLLDSGQPMLMYQAEEVAA